MKISISATNPCHLHPMAVELAQRGHLDAYYSGYPKWKLPGDDGFPVRTHSLRTNIVYGLLKFLPESMRPGSRDLFLWQDRGFDEWVGRNLRPCDFIHAMPGQCLHTFRRAKALGVRTVMNHATGPVREWIRIMRPEYERAGLDVEKESPYDADYLAREEEEYALADFHCAASTIVRDQLAGLGIDPQKMWVVPYGADREIFFQGDAAPPGEYRIVFAGQAGLRKDIRTLLQAVEQAERPGWQVDFYGSVLGEASEDISNYRGGPALKFHGPVSQRELAGAFRNGSVLVLPSLEEGFGLVVPQALNCGLPCIVSDRVGARDLIRHHENGSIFQTRNSGSLLRELLWWEKNRGRATDILDWKKPAETLISLSMKAASTS